MGIDKIKQEQIYNEKNSETEKAKGMYLVLPFPLPRHHRYELFFFRNKVQVPRFKYQVSSIKQLEPFVLLLTAYFVQNLYIFGTKYQNFPRSSQKFHPVYGFQLN